MRDFFEVLNSSHKQLQIAAALTWYIGGFVLALKANPLLQEAALLQPSSSAIQWSILCGLLIGALKAKYLFSKSCSRNINRINQLEQPKLWQFFRPRFILFLLLMITLGSLLSKQAHGDFNYLIGVATVDISLATALLGSSYLFWSKESSDSAE